MEIIEKELTKILEKDKESLTRIKSLAKGDRQDYLKQIILEVDELVSNDEELRDSLNDETLTWLSGNLKIISKGNTRKLNDFLIDKNSSNKKGKASKGAGNSEKKGKENNKVKGRGKKVVMLHKGSKDVRDVSGFDKDSSKKKGKESVGTEKVKAKKPGNSDKEFITMIIKKLIVKHPTWDKAQVADKIKSMGRECNPITLSITFKDVHDVMRLLKE